MFSRASFFFKNKKNKDFLLTLFVKIDFPLKDEFNTMEYIHCIYQIFILVYKVRGMKIFFFCKNV